MLRKHCLKDFFDFLSTFRNKKVTSHQTYLNLSADFRNTCILSIHNKTNKSREYGAFYGTKKGEEIRKLGPIEIFLKVMITSIYSHKSQNGNRKMCPAQRSLDYRNILASIRNAPKPQVRFGSKISQKVANFYTHCVSKCCFSIFIVFIDDLKLIWHLMRKIENHCFNMV